MSLQANAFKPEELDRLREHARNCTCKDFPSCDLCRLLGTCDAQREVIRLLREKLSNITADDLSDAERVKFAGRLCG